MTVLLTDDYGDDHISTAQLEQQAATLLKLAGTERYEISILITDDTAIQEINKTWRDKDKATNVLSFPMEDAEDSPHPMLGDIIISIDTARHEAVEKKQSLQAYLCRLLVHGFVHLLGHDHEESDQAYTEMLALEHFYLQKLNQENYNG